MLGLSGVVVLARHGVTSSPKDAANQSTFWLAAQFLLTNLAYRLS
jgi:hypothetical protein